MVTGFSKIIQALEVRFSAEYKPLRSASKTSTNVVPTRLTGVFGKSYVSLSVLSLCLSAGAINIVRRNKYQTPASIPRTGISATYSLLNSIVQ